MTIYATKVIVNGLSVQVYKNDNQQHISFIDTGLKFNDQKVYEGYMFLEDSDRVFQGYFYKTNIKQLINKRGKALHEKNVGKTFVAFSKDLKLTWSEWFNAMSNNSEVCTGKVLQVAI